MPPASPLYCREYLAWKESGPSPEFQSLMATSDITPWCQMCIAAAQAKINAYDHHHQEYLAWHYKMKLTFDVLNAQLDAERSESCRGSNAWWQVQLSDDEYVKLWSNDAALTVPEGFGGDLFKPQWQPAMADMVAAAGTTAMQ